jgi:hypothetical protein
MNIPLIRIGICLLCALVLPAQAAVKTLKQWISEFDQSGVSLFYSSEFLTTEKLNQPIGLEQLDASQLNLALNKLSLQLVPVNNEASATAVYLIRPLAKTPVASILIQALDSERQTHIRQFSLTPHSGDPSSSEASAVLLNLSGETNLQATVTAPGYYPASINQPLTPGQTINLKVSMEPLPLALSDIRVSTSLVNYNTGPENHHSFSRQDLNRQVRLGQDPLRSREQLPGSTSNGINGKTHTRGGQVNESMVILDDRELRNPYHFKDFYALFSTIDDTIVESIDHYSGVFPVQYGGRLSAVLDVQSNSFTEVPTHQLNLGLLSAGYAWHQQNPTTGSAWLLSVRTGGRLISDQLIEDLTISPEYDDAYFKATQQPSAHWTVSQHLLVSRDEIAIDQEEEMARADYHDQNFWINWAYDDWQNHQMHIQLYGNRRHDRRTGVLADDNSQAQVNEDIVSHFQGLKFTHQWQLTDQILVHYGLDVSVEDTRIQAYRNINHFSPLTEALHLSRQAERMFDFDEHGVAASSFANLRYQFNDRWIADLGVHYRHQQWLQGGDLSPRFNLAWFASERTNWRLGIGRHQQTQHIDELLLEADQPGYFAPASADLAVLDFEHTLANDWQLKTELYYKKYSSTHPYYENLFNGLHVLPDLLYDRIRIDPEDARAVGMEWTLSGQHDALNWAASYTYADVIDEIGGEDIPRSWNQRNAIKLMLGWSVGNWQANLNTTFHNGWPLTRVVQTDSGYLIETRNQATHRDFYQLNLGLNRRWATELGQWHLGLQLSNALNTRNPCCRDYQLAENDLSFTEKHGLPLVPDVRLSLSWD